MDIRQFRAELAQAFEEAGFERRTIPRCKDSKWVLPGREVERCFFQHALRRPWGYMLDGGLTIDVPAFRSWLNAQFPADQHGILSSGLLGRLIANEPDMFFAIDEGPPPYREWVGLIKTKLAALPDTIEGLLAAEWQPQRLKFIWDGWAAPPAFNYFKAWAIGSPRSSRPPFMLPDGQIVDAAANDLA